MAKLILRDNLIGSIDVSHCVHCILAGFLSGEAGGAFSPHGFGLPPLENFYFACQLIQVFSFRYTLLWLVFSCIYFNITLAALQTCFLHHNKQ